MNNMELATALITSPTKAFESLKERPRFLFPLLVVTLAAVGLLVWYYSIVDFPWLTEHLLSANPQMGEMTQQQREAAERFMTPTFLTAASVVSVIVIIAIARLIEAGYFTLAGNVANVRQSFAHWFALGCWTALPQVLGSVAAAAFLLTAGTNQIGNEELGLLSLNELFFHVPQGGKGFTLLSSLTVLHPWSWALTVLGVRVWSGKSWLFSSVFTLLPIVLFWGVWALLAFR